ncbi:MAG: ABC transporter ATP-binding protein [Abditibacteriales bacterium]|nr:ABC transporter ATP-binding protein [Abditibacteriales bacterium]MDW8365491.1 ATP-binding cassette domain-containing protein [Abditibacteriales bacterium]
MVEVEQLTKKYGEVTAIKDVSFRVERGDILGFLGPNGAGKTTTMRILTCFMAPTSGTARVGGYDIFKDSLEVRRLIGYLPEGVPLYRDMAVRKYLLYCAALRGVPRRGREDRVDEVMAKTHVDEFADKIIGKLSKGQRQRVGLAQAIVHDPPVLILDEPTASLDPAQTREARELIRTLGKDHTIILSTHILAEVSMVCNRVIIIDGGEVKAVDTPDNLSRQIRQSDVIQLRFKRAPSDAAQQLRKLKGVQRVQQQDGAFMVETSLDADLREELAAFAVNKGWGLLELRRMELSLEDAFIEITSGHVERIVAASSEARQEGGTD